MIVDQPSVAEIRLATKHHVYSITANALHDQNFLGCTCYNRQRQTTSYLAEGLLDEEIWSEIAKAIEEIEMLVAKALPGRLF